MIPNARSFLGLFLVLAVGIFSLGKGSAPARAEEPPLPHLLQKTRFIAYTPRTFAINGGRIRPATASGIRADLALLRPFFNGLITYSATSGLEVIPEIARELGFRAVILGIWDPLSVTEVNNVICAARQYPGLIGAIIVGNEGLYTRRYLPQDVEQVRRRIRKELPHLPVTTSEPFFLYLEKETGEFLNSFDLLMPNVHPVFEKWFAPNAFSQGVNMVLEVAAKLQMASRKPLLIKETGLPSGPSGKGFDPDRQARFWSELLHRFPFSPSRSLVCFEAFDAPWKPAEIALTLPGDHSSEGFWGFFTEKGKKKKVVAVLPALQE